MDILVGFRKTLQKKPHMYAFIFSETFRNVLK